MIPTMIPYSSLNNLKKGDIVRTIGSDKILGGISYFYQNTFASDGSFLRNEMGNWVAVIIKGKGECCDREVQTLEVVPYDQIPHR